MINISCQMNHQWVGNPEKLETSKISQPAGIGYQSDNFVCTKKMGYNVQAAIKFWHIYLQICQRAFSMTLILLVSLFIFLILPAIPLVPLHFIKWYLKHICTQRLMIHQIFLLAHNWPKCMWQKLTVSHQLHYQKTVRVLEQMMSMEKYLCIFLHQIEAIVYIYLLKCTPM